MPFFQASNPHPYPTEPSTSNLTKKIISQVYYSLKVIWFEIELDLHGVTHLDSESHTDASRSHLSRTTLLASCSLSRLHVLCSAIYMSLHHTHLYGSNHKTIWIAHGGGKRKRSIHIKHVSMGCIGSEWVAPAAESFTFVGSKTTELQKK